MADVTDRQRPRARRAAGRVFGLDLVLLRAPSADVGLTSIAAYLEANNYNVRLVGLPAGHLHEELIEDPAVDFVLCGDSTEEPCRQLLRALREGTPLAAVEN